MRRFWLLATPFAVLLSGCTIEETPQEYIDHLTPPATVMEEAHEELTARLISIGPALQRGDRASVNGALAPAPDVVVIGPRLGQEHVTPEAIADSMISFAGGSNVRPAESSVTVGANNATAWFRTSYILSGGELGERELNFSGVFVRQDGNWRLAQGHLSSDLSQTPPPPAADEPTPEGE